MLMPGDLSATVSVAVNPSGVDGPLTDTALGGFPATNLLSPVLQIAYTWTMSLTVTAGLGTVSFAVQYRIGGGAWTDIATKVEVIDPGSGSYNYGPTQTIDLVDLPSGDIDDLDVQVVATASGGTNVNLSGTNTINWWRVHYDTFSGLVEL